MTTYIDSVQNQPDLRSDYAGGKDPVRYYDFTTFNEVMDNTSLGGSKARVTCYMPVPVNFHPGTIILSDVPNTTVEASCSPHSALLGGTAVFVSLTAATIMKLDSVFTALRFTNTGSGSISVQLAV